MDNQQETKFLFELGWLVGIIEGEGTLSIYPSAIYKGKKQYKPVFRICNTDYRIIERIIDFCKKLDIAIYIKEEKPRIPKIGNYQYRPLYNIVISGYKRIKNFLEIVKPKYFVGKREQAALVYEFVISRLNSKPEMGWQSTNWHYSARELEIFNKIKKLNLRGKGKRILTDYTPNTDNNSVKI